MQYLGFYEPPMQWYMFLPLSQQVLQLVWSLLPGHSWRRVSVFWSLYVASRHGHKTVLWWVFRTSSFWAHAFWGWILLLWAICSVSAEYPGSQSILLQKHADVLSKQHYKGQPSCWQGVCHGRRFDNILANDLWREAKYCPSSCRLRAVCQSRMQYTLKAPRLDVMWMRVREKTATLEGVMTRIVPPLSPPPLDSNLSMKEFITIFEVTKRQSRRNK